jgi:hypothetical protein
MSNPTGVRARRLDGVLAAAGAPGVGMEEDYARPQPAGSMASHAKDVRNCFYIQPAADSASAHLPNYKLCPLEDRQALERLRLPDGISEVVIVFDSTTDATQIFRFGHALTTCLLRPICLNGNSRSAPLRYGHGSSR